MERVSSLFAFQFQDMGICIEEIDEDYSDPAYDLKEAAEAVIGLIFHIGAQKRYVSAMLSSKRFWNSSAARPGSD